MKKYRVLFNLGTLKKGGGQNVGLNFLHAYVKLNPVDIDAYFLVAADSDVHRFVLKNKLNIIRVVSNNPAKRIIQEYFQASLKIKQLKIDVIYSYFGYGVFQHVAPQVSGSADSNLYYPEVDFWCHYKGVHRLAKWVIDKYRVFGIKRSDALIFENKALEERAKTLFGIEKTQYIKPSINFHIKSIDYPLPPECIKSSKIGLFLCGWQLNKNIMLIPQLAKDLRERGINFQFIITATKDDSEICKQFCNKLEEFQVKDMVSIVGGVSKSQLKSLYEQVDFVFLLSLLESFSNNIIESWYFERPLIVADEGWSRSICKKAAIFVDRDSPDSICQGVSNLINNPESSNEVVTEGIKELATFPTIDERTLEELRYLKYVSQTH
mgnify:CR=1 FL=1